MKQKLKEAQLAEKRERREQKQQQREDRAMSRKQEKENRQMLKEQQKKDAQKQKEQARENFRQIREQEAEERNLRNQLVQNVEKEERPARPPKKELSRKEEKSEKVQEVPDLLPMSWTASYIPLKQVKNGIIQTSDNRFVKIVEVLPINFLLRSSSEQRSIILSFMSYLKIAPPNIQLKVLSRKADIQEYIDKIHEEAEKETDERCKILQEDYAELIKSLGMKEAITRRFFLIFEYPSRSGSKNPDERDVYLATNHILLMIWKYFAEIIDEIEKNTTENEEQKPEQEEREGQKENPNESEEEPEEEKQGNTGSQTEQNEDKIRKEDTEQESETEDKTERNGKDQETEDHENGRTAELQKFLQQLCENLPKCVRESGGFEDKQNECGIPASETEASSDNALQKILYEMAKETLDKKIQKEIFEHLQKELMEIPFEEGHDLVQKKLCRKTEISDFLKLLTEKYEGQLKQVKKRLRLKLLPILKNQKERTEHKLFLGRRVDLRNIAAPSGAVFKKQQPGKKLDICVAVLVDNSFSMCGERMDYAILAALCLYDFCMESEIPVLVCGHHTDGYRHENLKDETVYLHCCADFETDEKDRFRIAGMQSYGSNRDGTALWYAGSRLLERPEKQKLLFVISDGAPNANQYGGTGAKRDLQKIRKKLLQQGVFFQAAAIGSDKEAIQEIYEESFLDITDLEQLPALLTKKLLRFIRR